MLFGHRQRFAIECELTDTTRPYFFGRFRIWIADRPHGDFAGEIISTYVIYLGAIVREYASGGVDCTARLPYMERLEWRVARRERGERIVARVRGEEPVVVDLRPGEFREACEQFFEWVLGHPEFTAVKRADVYGRAMAAD